MVLQSIMQKLIRYQQENQNQEKELSARPGRAFKIKDNIAWKEAPETELHRPGKVPFELLNPFWRNWTAFPSKSEDNHHADEDQIEEQKEIIKQIVDAGQSQRVPQESQAENGYAAIFFMLEV